MTCTNDRSLADGDTRREIAAAAADCACIVCRDYLREYGFLLDGEHGAQTSYPGP